jgi:hypothetical protein
MAVRMRAGGDGATGCAGCFSVLLAAALALGLAIFWRGLFGIYFPGSDEWALLSLFAGIADPESLVRFMFVDWNGHLVPVFKALFYLEYKVFGLVPAKYHVVTIGLLWATLVLFREYIAEETREMAMATLGTLFLGFSVAYYPIVTWQFHHQVLLMAICLELGLLRVARAGGEGAGGPVREYAVAGMYGLVGALSYGMGAVSWAIMTVAYGMKYLAGGVRVSPRAALARLGALWAPALAYAAMYGYFVAGKGAAPASGGAGVFRTVEAGALMVGNTALLGVGVVGARVAPWLASTLGGGTAISWYRGLMLGALGALVALTVMLLIQGRGDRRVRVLAGLAWTIILLTAGLIAVVRAGDGGTAVEMATIPRYNFFPFMGMAVLAVAALLGAARAWGRGRAVIVGVAVFAAIGVAEYRLVREVIQASLRENEGRMFVVSLIRSGLAGEGSRTVPLYPGHMMNKVPYGDLFAVFAEPGDIVVKQGEERVFVLRDYVPVRPGELALEGARTGAGGETIEVEADTARIVWIPGEGGRESGGERGHLVLWVRSWAEGELTVRCGGREERVAAGGGLVFKRHVIPCTGTGAVEVAAAGLKGARLKDPRLYR